MPILEILRTANHALLRNWGRAVLTSLSMVVGTASLVLVVVTGVSGRDYIMGQIRGVGTNLIVSYREWTDEEGANLLSERLNQGDLDAIRKEIPGARNVAPLVQSVPKITLQGITHRVTLIGTTPDYRQVRNIQVVSGRFIDEDDEKFRNRVCAITPQLEEKLKRDPLFDNSVRFYDIPFRIIGVFREKTNTYGNMEISDNSAVIPLSVMRYFETDGTFDYIYTSAESMERVPEVSEKIRNLLVRRHGQQVYKVDNLSDILKAADKIRLGLTLVLLVIAAISLIASGISIMNVMLITVTERTREIGIKKAIGANRKVLLTEFLVEALILSGGGGTIGVLIGAAVPYSVRFFTTAIQIEIPPGAIILGFGVTLLVGLTFGMIPALRASRLNPVESLRYE
ncbi:MAG: ABC transporter permease [Acidobacteria bacterium]|nr:ABC transporter permease [Acidobacteriota bacterium]